MKTAVVLLLLVGVSCAPRGPVPFRPRAKVELVTLGENKRTAQFEQLVGRGAIEFRWTDEKGTHKEQGELDFWKKGNAISLRISKLGELLAWFGGEGKEFWFFDLMGDEPILTLGGEQSMFNDIDVALVLLGLMPVPLGEPDNVDVDHYTENPKRRSVDKYGRIWKATYMANLSRPLTIEMKSRDRLASAAHHQGIRVEIANLHELYWPETGGTVDLTDNQGDSEIKIAFSSLSTIVVNEPMDRVFNLEYLKSALKPVQILQGK